ncbi:histidinol-phosphate transaminase [Arthrobacter sp. MYb23]|uniref:histidinol-phosphate transaminase n=1 Tax=Arthrobacter sp. MYb23 TaxID=1848603 RepID=UPI0021574651|nr:histidinol-phosphate transaminase [Arthrobacter sp. MYb23]
MGELRVRKELSAIPDYKAGKTAPSAIGVKDMFKLSSNENPFGPLPSVVDAIAGHLGSINRYPEMAASALTAAVAERYEVDPAAVVFGSGSVEVVSQLIRATAGSGDEVLFAWRSFEAYPLLVLAAGATPVRVPLNDDFGHDLEGFLERITDRTRLILLCNPNNPTGTTLGHEEVERFLDRVPSDIAVVIDEAYVQFNRRPDTADGIRLYRKFPNVAVAHTFSKAYGLAGLRVGYAIAPVGLASALRKVALPFGVTQLAQIAALASLKAESELGERVDWLVGERIAVVDALRRKGWRVPETEGNFLWLPLGAATSEAAQILEEQGILIRPFPGEGLRISIGGPGAAELIVDAVEVLVEKGHTGGAFEHAAKEGLQR